MRASKGLARVFSTLFHPLFIPTLGIFVLFQLNSYVAFSLATEARRVIILLVFINTAIIPVFSVIVLKRTGWITDFFLSDRGERIFPLVIASVMFFLTYYMLLRLSLPGVVYFFVLGATVLVLLTLIVSFFWKISIHMVSLGGFTGFLIVVSLLLHTDIPWLIAMAILASGCTGASRILLKAHSPAQVYAGYLLGVVAMLLLFWYFSI